MTVSPPQAETGDLGGAEERGTEWGSAGGVRQLAGGGTLEEREEDDWMNGETL